MTRPINLLVVCLGNICQVSYLHSVKGDPLAFPVGGDGGNILGQRMAVGVGEACVGGQHPGGQHAAPAAHGREHRQGHRQGAAPHAGQILNGQNLFHYSWFRFLLQV